MTILDSGTGRRQRPRGFSLVELLLGSAIMLTVIVGALAVYNRSNKVSVDQQQLAQIQHDVRSSMFFLARDSRSAGVGLIPEITGYFLEGTDSFSPNPEQADSIRMMGNFDDPLDLRILQYQGGGGGGAATAFLYEFSLENAPYTCPDFYENKTYIIISTRCPGCFTFRFIPDNAVHGCGSGTAHFNFQPGQSELNPPGGLVDTGCSDDCWDDAIVTFGQIRLYWLDTTGAPGDYPSLTLAVGQDGYLGIPGTLYMTTVGDDGGASHLALAQNIENLQFEYNLDLNNDGNLDGFQPWDNAAWTILAGDDQATRDAKALIISSIRQVRIQILGRTPNKFVSLGGNPPGNLHLYRRPALSNSPAMTSDDFRRRFLIESTSNIRNLSLNIYNTGYR